MRRRLGHLASAILVLAATGAAAEETPSRPAVTLAILVEQDTPAEAEAVRALLAEALETDAEFRVLDRDHISKVLREHALSLSGAVQAPVQTGRMFGASYLVYAVPQTGGPRPTLGLLCIEVGSGNVLYERAVALDLPRDDAGMTRGAGCIPHLARPPYLVGMRNGAPTTGSARGEKKFQKLSKKNLTPKGVRATEGRVIHFLQEM